MVFDLNFFLLAIPALIFVGMSKGGFGSAVSFAATPLLALILTPGQAIGLMLPLLIAMDFSAVKLYWGKWDSKVARVLIIGSLPGIVLAGLLYNVASPDLFRFLIGLVAISFVIYQLCKGRGWIPKMKPQKDFRAGYFWGCVAGFTSFISHAGGPPMAVYMLSNKFDKTTYQATSVLVFTAINLLKVVPYFIFGVFSVDTLKADVLLLPFGIIGVLLGGYLHHKMPEKLFFAITYVFLVIIGSKLIFESLT